MTFRAAYFAERALIALLAPCLTTSLSSAAEPAAPTLPVIEWTVESAKPVIPLGFQGELDKRRAGCCSVIRFGDKYRMYYWGEDSEGYGRILAADAPLDKPMAFKPAGIVLERQADKPHNSKGPTFGYVFPRDDGPWLMYVCTSGDAPAPQRWATYVATSDDQGKSWRYASDEPMLPRTRPWNKIATGSVSVLREGDKWRAHYTSFGEKGLDWVGIGYAESTDGLHWSYPVDHLVVEPRGDASNPPETLCSKPWVIKDDGAYRMWVGSMKPSGKQRAYRLRTLTSADGIHWEWQTDPEWHDDGRLLGGVGKAGSFDDRMRSYASVIRAGDEYLLWYTGNDYGKAGMGFARGKLAPR